jgi:hypothetical protein
LAEGSTIYGFRKGNKLGTLPVKPIHDDRSLIQVMAGGGACSPEILHLYQRPPDMGNFGPMSVVSCI